MKTFQEFLIENADPHMMKVACSNAAAMSREQGHNEQANEFSQLAQKLEGGVEGLSPDDLHMVKLACQAAAADSRDYGHEEQANEFTRIWKSLETEE
jgi:hypothetical protein